MAYQDVKAAHYRAIGAVLLGFALGCSSLFIGYNVDPGSYHHTNKTEIVQPRAN